MATILFRLRAGYAWMGMMWRNDEANAGLIVKVCVYVFQRDEEQDY